MYILEDLNLMEETMRIEKELRTSADLKVRVATLIRIDQFQ